MALTAYSGQMDLSLSLSPIPPGARACSWYTLGWQSQLRLMFQASLVLIRCSCMLGMNSFEVSLERIFLWAGLEKFAISASQGTMHQHVSPWSIQSQQNKRLPILHQQHSGFDSRNIPPCPGNWVKCDSDEQDIGHNLWNVTWLQNSSAFPHSLQSLVTAFSAIDS